MELDNMVSLPNPTSQTKSAKPNQPNEISHTKVASA
jgi:hypothetical protein